MRRLGSLTIEAALESRVPAGQALAVDREAFSRRVTEWVREAPGVTVVEEEVAQIPEEGIVILASGPLTSERLSDSIREFTGSDYLYFYDAVSPVVEVESVDFEKAFRASRYGKGGDDYVNCPLSREEYLRFHEALLSAATVDLNAIDNALYFEGCLPIEVMAARGVDTLRFGPMKPVGLRDPRTGREPYACVQLRQDNLAATLYNLVGFQNQLKWGEQKRILRLIPGLENAEFSRYGMIHRNTYINSPTVLRPTFQTRARESLFFAGQILRSRGIHGVRRFRHHRRDQRRPPRPRRRDARTDANHGARLPLPLHHAGGGEELSADERLLRSSASSRPAGCEQEGPKPGAGRAGALRSRRVRPRHRSLSGFAWRKGLSIRIPVEPEPVLTKISNLLCYDSRSGPRKETRR